MDLLTRKQNESAGLESDLDYMALLQVLVPHLRRTKFRGILQSAFIRATKGTVILVAEKGVPVTQKTE